uniref:Putative presegetalin H1 n=1 Tax=Gypsophila vaccaria TaxID=39387 RepID=F6LNM8_GYPVA|nr:putative presegetalin H1 [Gypsophila vaccaria]
MSPIFAHDIVKPKGYRFSFQAKDAENASAPV